MGKSGWGFNLVNSNRMERLQLPEMYDLLPKIFLNLVGYQSWYKCFEIYKDRTGNYIVNIIPKDMVKSSGGKISYGVFSNKDQIQLLESMTSEWKDKVRVFLLGKEITKFNILK